MIRLFKGNYKDGLNFFKQLTKNGKKVHSTEKITVYKLSDNTHISYRKISKSGPPTIGIKMPGVNDEIKLKFIGK